MRVLNNLAMIYICFNKLPEALDTLEMAYKLGNRNFHNLFFSTNIN